MATGKQTKELKEILINRRDNIRNNIKDGVDNIAKLNDCDCKDELDFAEASSDSFTSGIIITQQRNELEEIESALKSIENKTYGICEMCDEPILLGRLKAKPFAKFCTDCREIHESNTQI